MQNASSWLTENWFKIAALAVVFILGLGMISYLYAKEDNRRSEELAAAEQNKLEEERRYAAEKKSDCLAIYTTENAKWDNVNGWRYDERGDRCYIQYKDSKPKTAAECDKNYPLSGEYGYLNVLDNLLCKDGNFEQSY